ncbi:MAG TPA: DUF5107 domain-containing protein, partial [Fimbriimonadaceae bacterium]|nr:DUF5107 domain-containing protein [Fimbriimonadaceae bacterium]
NAWASGGIEWNVGVFGHSVFTCSPVFAARTAAPDGGDGLRIWEYERIRGIVWQVDFWAPDGSDFLFWSPRIVNPHDETIPMYWWTNAAVAEEPGARVLAPTRYAIEADHDHGDALVRRDLEAEPDLTFPQRRGLPRDTYFDIPAGERPWIAHVGADGKGAVHLSSPRLFGRKQWVWGMEEGGRRWQEWLNPGAAYVEIQAGLTTRQSETIPMPAHADWQWLEAFGPIEGVDVSRWRSAVQQVWERAVRQSEFEERQALLAQASRVAPLELLQIGSGWGALEAKRRETLGLRPLSRGETPFPSESLGPGQDPWIRVLSGGGLMLRDPSEGDAYVTPEWRGFLEASPDSWIKYLHLGLIAWQEGDCDGARVSWERSRRTSPNGWAERNLAILARLEGDLQTASDRIIAAHRLQPNDPQIADEVCRICAEAVDFEALEDVLRDLSKELRKRPRVRLAAAQAALRHGRFREVAAYFASPCDLADIREAETTLTDLWRDLCAADPTQGLPESVPPAWDFRMRH